MKQTGITYVKVNGNTYTLVSATEYLWEAGRYNRVWHKFIKGWCEKLNRWVTFCMGTVKSRIVAKWFKFTRQVWGAERRMLMGAGSRIKVEVALGTIG